MIRGLFFRLLCCLCLDAAVAQAQDSVTPVGERERIARERAAVEALFTGRQAACQSRFAVTDCVNDAKTERREALAPLRRQAIALDDAERKQRAARRLEDVRNKVGGAQAREPEVVVRKIPAAARKAAAAPPDEPAPAAAREANHAPVPRPVTARTPRKLPSQADRQAQESANRARIEARKQAVQAHREAVERRNAQRALTNKRANPLPVPASAALP
jgi:colicin import membrane protein